MARYTYQEPWTAGFHRLADTVYQILDARNKEKLINAQLEEVKRKNQREDRDAKMKEDFINEARRVLTPQQQTIQVPDPSKQPGMGAGPFRPEYMTTQQTVNMPVDPQEQLMKLVQLAGQFGDIKTAMGGIRELVDSQSPRASKPFQANNLYDLFAVQSAEKHGGDVTSPEGYNQFLKWAGTPEGIKEWREYMSRQAKGETFKEQFIGPAVDNPNMDVWTVYDQFGKGHTELRPSAGQALPRNIGRTPSTEMNRGVALDTIKGNISRIKSTYNPDYVGPVAGRAFGAKEALVGLPEQQSAFYADVRDIADMLLRARSGAQINEEEYNRLSKLIPSPNLPPKAFEARLKRFEEQLEQIYQAQSSRLSAGGYLPGPKPKQQNRTSNETGPATKALIQKAQQGDKQAQSFLKSKGIIWQQ